MKGTFLVFVTIALLALAGCSSQQKIDTAVAEQTANLSAQVADLRANLTTMQAERDDAVAQLTSFNETVAGRDAIINDDTTKLQSCWNDRTMLQEQNANLSKKIDVLQGWVDVCQKTLGNLG